jgi:aldehyde:ferredoxin oxidoreductase
VGFTQMGNPDPAKYNPAGSGPLDLAATTATEVLNAAGLCMFSTFAMPQTAQSQLIEAVTGWPFQSPDELRAGIRIMDMRQAFNVREGLKPADFVLPPRTVGEPPQTAGPHEGRTIDHKALAQNWFAEIGWDPQTGKPSRSTLELLGGMDDVVEDLYE